MSRNGALVPESKQSLQNFKYEVANSLNVDLKQGYNDRRSFSVMRYVRKGAVSIHSLFDKQVVLRFRERKHFV